ncbi:hypothetical protein QL285_049951 [Trifolium repens]|nr:hypothetical protein QL285_049951 [Trifolium repens]
MSSALMKILSPTTIGCLVAPTRFTATSSTPGVFSSVLSKKRLHPTITEILDSPTSSTLPSSAPGLNLSVLLKNCLPPTIHGFLGQPYKPHHPSTPGVPSVLSKYCLAPNQPWNFRRFHKLQHQTLLVSNYLQQSHKLPSLITVAFNCLPEDLPSFALLQPQLKHNPQGLHSHTTLVQQFHSLPYLSLDSQELLLNVCLPLVPLVTNSTSI